MNTDESVLDLVLLNLSAAASLVRNRLLLSVPEGTMTRSDATEGCSVNFDISSVRK